MFQLFSQQDPRWSKDFLGDTNYTCGRWGCLSVVLTMQRNYLINSVMSPKQSIKKLRYRSSGDLEWSSLPAINLILVTRVRTRDDVLMKKYFESPIYEIAIQVNNNHWVWMLSKNYLPILGYKIADPWTGTIAYTNRYKNNITGFAAVKAN